LPWSSESCNTEHLAEKLTALPMAAGVLAFAGILQGDNRAIGVSAGTFTVLDKKRTPRPPITEISFTTQDDPVPVEARLLGTNAYNDIRAALDFDRGAKLIHS
jgi:hypothetical protein